MVSIAENSVRVAQPPPSSIQSSIPPTAVIPANARDPAPTPSSRPEGAGRLMDGPAACAGLTPGPGQYLSRLSPPSRSMPMLPPPHRIYGRARDERVAVGDRVGWESFQSRPSIRCRGELTCSGCRRPSGDMGADRHPVPCHRRPICRWRRERRELQLRRFAGWKVPKILIVRRGFESNLMPTTGSDDEPRLAVPFPDGRLQRTRRP